MERRKEEKSRFHDFGLFILFLVCGILIFVSPVLIKELYRTMYSVFIPILFLIIIAFIYLSKNLKSYFPVFLAFLVASLVYSPQLFLGPGTTIEGKTYTTFLTALLVILPIILITKISGKEMSSIYLNKGNLRLGLIIGLATFLFFLVTSVPVSIWIFGGKEISRDRLISLTPWIAVFVFSNAIKEEILFRGLFLKKYEYILGATPSNFLQATIFSLAHLYVPFDSFLPLYLFMTFLLGLGFGAVMQKTDSALAAILFHAGADIPVILAVFSLLS